MTTNASRPLISRASLAEQAYEVIKQRILDLDLKPGQVITEAEMSEMLSISKSPIRAALIHLQRDGLIEITPYTETIVSKLEVGRVRQLYEARSLIEPHVIEAVTPQLVVHDECEIQAILNRAQAALDHGDYATFFKTNTEFHGYFIRRHGNEFFWNSFRVIDYQMQRIRMLSAAIINHPTKQMAEHRMIFDAVKHRDAQGAANAMRKHILGYFDDLLREIDAALFPGLCRLLHAKGAHPRPES